MGKKSREKRERLEKQISELKLVEIDEFCINLFKIIDISPESIPNI